MTNMPIIKTINFTYIKQVNYLLEYHIVLSKNIKSSC